MNKTLVGLVAAAGILGCAKDVPVYTQRDLLASQGNVNVYTSVWSNAERLELGIEAEQAGQLVAEVSLTRYELANETSCLREEMYIFASDGNGQVKITETDEACDGTIDKFVGDIYGEHLEGTRADFGDQLDADFEQGRSQMDQLFDISEQVESWHARKQ